MRPEVEGCHLYPYTASIRAAAGAGESPLMPVAYKGIASAPIIAVRYGSVVRAIASSARKRCFHNGFDGERRSRKATREQSRTLQIKSMIPDEFTHASSAWR